MYMKDYCKETYSEHTDKLNFVENCALAHVNEKGGNFDNTDISYFDFSDFPWCRNYHDAIKNASELVLWIGVLLFLIGYKIEQNNITYLIIVLNIALSVPYLAEVSNRYGVDYVAYIQQAAAVYNGETDYSKLSSHLGPCFYPAGHIMHYIPAYWLHLQTEYAENIVKMGHILIHTGILVFINKITYLYMYDSTKDKDDESQKSKYA